MSAANSNAFTTREQEIMAMAWQCFEGEPKVPLIPPTTCCLDHHPDIIQVDYKKLAELCGMTNPGSAANSWAKIKKKLAAQASEAGNGTTAADGGESPAKTTPKATPKRKKNATADVDDAESPTKKAKTPKGKGKGKKSEAKVEEDGDAAADGTSSVKKEDEEDGLFN